MSAKYEFQHVPYTDFNDLLNLKGKTAIVTGGGSGIGLAVARRLAEAGANVVMAALAEEHSAEIINDGFPAMFVKTNITNEDDVENLVNSAVQRFGSVNILANVAGIYPLKPIHEVEPAFWDKVFAINTKGPFFLAQKVTEQMVRQGNGGAVVNISSLCAHRPMKYHVTYDTTKGAVLSMTRNMAYSLAEYGIRVNSISPGNVATESQLEPTLLKQQEEAGTLKRIPLGRPAEPFEIANAVLYLCAPISSYITGIDVKVDGGWAMYCM